MPAWGEHGSVSETAEHWQRAGEARQELQWRIRAAEAAYAAHANREAVHHWLRVIAVWDDVPDAEELAGRPLYDVYLTADWAVFDAGMSALTVQLAAEAIARFPDAPLHVRAMLLRRQARSTAWLDFDAALPLLEQALALFEGGPPVPEWVYALSDIADARRGFGRYEEALGAGRKGVEIASVCEVSLVRRMHLACALAQHALGDEDGVEQSLAALRHAPEPDTLRERSIVAMRQVWLLIAMGRYAEVAPAGQEVLQMLAQFGASGSRLATMLRSSVAEALLVLGDVAAAAAPEVLGAVNDDDQPHLTDVEQGELILLAGDSDRAEAYFVELAGRWPGIPDWTPYLHSARAEVAAWRDDPAQALAHAAAGLASAIDNDYLHVSGILLTQAARAAGDLGRDADDAEQERLLGELDRLRAELQVDDPLAGSTRQAGAAVATWDAERARLAGADDEQAWLAAASAWQQMGARFRAGYCQWRRAETLLAHRAKRVETVEVLRAALDLAQDHVPLSRAIEATAARARIALPDGGVTPPEPVRRDFGLTERELAVLKLVGAGQTNAQIGAQLYMSPKTASVHVTNILRKLGVATRTHAAAVAERAGLLD
jgi:DNA-binding CsgD family transcriptional regulator